tara:strand:- start:340 stop:717 length:378 start_codon:yes stop_codon:yes gene_type:complete
MFKFLFLFFVVGTVALVYQYFERRHYAQTVISRVTLETNCAMELEAFAVKNLNSGEIREFQHGEAFIKATLADNLKIVLAEKFQEVSFEGEVFPATAKVEVFQDCDKTIGIEGVFKSFNKQFSSN